VHFIVLPLALQVPLGVTFPLCFSQVYTLQTAVMHKKKLQICRLLVSACQLSHHETYQISRTTQNFIQSCGVQISYPLFTVFHVRAPYYTKTLITNKCTKSFIINRNTLLHVSTLLGHLQGELSVAVTLGLHFTVEWECAADCVLEAWTLCGPGLQAGTAESSRFQKQRSTQSTAHSHSTIKCNLSVTATKKFSLKMTQQDRNM
jgi:hypothetical protein